ncbi:MAG: pimeloyl-CoA dehydrogenase large subunit [Rhodospirillaceae bacterium]|nr:pimeloyl-CoA dehydrogenase large subunit [Rhodospirillaceae bacterium]
MTLELGPADRAFRDDVRAWLAGALPAWLSDKVENGLELAKDDYLLWQKALHARGWMAPNWPTEWGGTGWTPIQRYLFEEETALAGAPRVIPFGVSMVGPVIIAFGSDAQKRHYLPRILSSADWWCQGYSEPGSGSDLASLRTRAFRDGDHYVVNGQKTWTTLAQHADMIFCLVRTSTEGKPQEGISFLLIDMKTPGITVRPIITMDGGHEVNDVFFEDVRVPVENLVGKENEGWTYAKFLLGHERFSITAVARSKRQLERVKRIAGIEQAGGQPVIADRRFRDRVAEVELDLMALEFTELRYLAAEAEGKAPGPEASLLKIKGTEVQQAITELTLDAVGYHALPYQPGQLRDGSNEPPIGPDYAVSAAPVYFNWRKASIYGGSNEIQKNIIAKMVLGL